MLNKIYTVVHYVRQYCRMIIECLHSLLHQLNQRLDECDLTKLGVVVLSSSTLFESLPMNRQSSLHMAGTESCLREYQASVGSYFYQ